MKPLLAFIIDYCQRHAHPVNAVLHIIGVPAVFTGIFFLFTGRAALGASLITGGYWFQYLGHQAQGNEVGEVTLVKHLWQALKTTQDRSKSVKQGEHQ